MATRIRILTLFLMPSILYIPLLIFQKRKESPIKTTLRKKNLFVQVPPTFSGIGIIVMVTSFLVVFPFTLFSERPPHFVFYFICECFMLLGLYLVVKANTFMIVVVDSTFTVFGFLKAPFSFEFSEITAVIRQAKNNRKKSERIIIRTVQRKKVIIEDSMIGYNHLLEAIQQKIVDNRLHGFNN